MVASSSQEKPIPPTPRITVDHLRKMANLLDEKISEYELSEMLLEADKDGDGEVSEQDFIRIMKRTVGLFVMLILIESVVKWTRTRMTSH